MNNRSVFLARADVSCTRGKVEMRQNGGHSSTFWHQYQRFLLHPICEGVTVLALSPIIACFVHESG